MATGIPASNYLAYFRLNIAMARDYIKNNDSNSIKPCMENAYSVVGYLGDVEVERHYAGIYLEMRDKFPNIRGVKKIDYFIEEEFYRDRTLASNLVARDLLSEANIKIKIEQDRNFNFILALMASLLLAIVLLLFAISAYSKLKTANTYRQWFSTALSHDLRSPVAEIAHALNGNHGLEKAKNALISYEYLLDDTLNMSLSSQKNKKVIFQEVDLKELLQELLLDLSFMVNAKEIHVSLKMRDNCIIKGDPSGLKILFRNILLNAIKHNHDTGFINIEEGPEKPCTLVISNSISENRKQDQESAGTFIIDYFIKQHKAKYSFEIVDKIAVVGVGFRGSSI
jgi:signal transduction histidine kinase